MNTVNKMENILEGIKSRLEDAEELVSALEDRNGKHSKMNSRKEKEQKEIRRG